jgi:hypothetical protein
MPQSPVEVILDVSPPQDWTFVTQPGAYRRIIMNIFGNSLVREHHCRDGMTRGRDSADVLSLQKYTVKEHCSSSPKHSNMLSTGGGLFMEKMSVLLSQKKLDPSLNSSSRAQR